MSMVRMEPALVMRPNVVEPRVVPTPLNAGVFSQVLNFPTYVEGVPLLGAKPHRFRQRDVPTELARAFDGAAMLVAIFAGRRRGERGSVEIAERRSAANAEVRIGDQVGALGEDSNRCRNYWRRCHQDRR